MSISVIAWRLPFHNMEDFRFQIKGVDNRNKSAVLRALGEHKIVGEVFNPRVKTEEFIASKTFQDASEARDFMRGFPYNLCLESPRDASLKRMSKGSAAAAKPRQKSTRRCSKCGGQGHNARTCSGKRANKTKGLVAVSFKKRAKSKCSRCGAVGHNARTCKMTNKEIDAAKSRRKTCGNCGEIGHNKRTCPLNR